MRPEGVRRWMARGGWSGWCAVLGCALSWLPVGPVRSAPPPTASTTTASTTTASTTTASTTTAPLSRAEKAYQRARQLAGRGEYRASARALPKRLASLPAAVAVDVRLRRARLLARTGQFAAAQAAAQALWRDLDGAGVRGERQACAALLAECALALSEPQVARDHLAPLLAAKRLGGLDRHTLALQLAAAEVALGHPEAAERGLAAALAKAPHGPLVDRVRDALSDLRGAVPVAESDVAQAQATGTQAVAGLSLDERLAQAEVLTQKGQAKDAVALLHGQRPPRARAQAARYYHVRGMALFRTRERYPEAAKDLQRAATLRGKTEASDAFHAARALSRADRDRAAVRGYQRFVQRYPRSRYADDAAYLAAWLSLRHGFPGGQRAMQRFVDGPRGRRSLALRKKGTFMLAMDAFLRRRFGRAETWFMRHGAMGEGAMVAARGSYWAGRAAQSAKQRKRARAHYERAYRHEPLHYYAQLARLRLAELGDVPAPFAQSPAGADTGPADTAVTDRALGSTDSATAFYRRLGFLDEAARALRREEKTVRDAHGLSGLVTLYGHLGDAARGYRLVAREVRGLAGRPPVGDDRALWEAAYPRPFAAAVSRATADTGLDGDLLYAVVRKESAFDPDVVSSAAAIGLTQLLAETAARFADAGPFEAARLYEPAYNLRLGARYLKALLDEFDGHAPLAIAAYNAGEHRVHAWLKREHKRRGPLPLDVFVERIPITQTHNYVRRVLGNWARYRYLRRAALGADTFWPPLPETL